MFKHIHTVQDILPFIEGREDIRLVDKGDYQVINYVVAMKDTFPGPDEDYELFLARRECRGLIFDRDGNIIRRPYHKFKNCGESPESQLSVIDLSQPHHVLEKLDGCCDENVTVTTPNGDKNIKQLCEERYKGVVLGFNHFDGKEEWVVVTNHSIQENNDDWYEITLENDESIKLTGNHKVWCSNRNNYVAVCDLTIDDEVTMIF